MSDEARVTIRAQLEAIARERHAKYAGIAMAALWVAEEYSAIDGRRVLEAFDLDADALRAADEVERIECYGADLDDAIALLKAA